MTFTGGEPFLRGDLDDMVVSAYRHCKPEVITIPTNGMLTERILEKVERMCRECPTSSIGINLSLDGIGDEHDDIRGVEGNWKLSMETWTRLKELQSEHKNLVLTVHTVISRFNAHRFKEIQEGLKFLKPDSYITEVAEERVELDTVGWGITPSRTTMTRLPIFSVSRQNRHPPKALPALRKPSVPNITSLPNAFCTSATR
jgi:MoaA/NifB/PqqE/SkfB family radical SAM enzyme